MSGGAMGQDLNILAGVGTVGERPENRIGIGGINVLADRNADFSAIRTQRCRALKPAPHFSSRRALCELQKDDLAQIRKGLVHREPLYSANSELIAQVSEEHRLKRHFF